MRKLASVALLAVTACSSGSTTVTLCNGTAMGKLTGTFSVCNEFEQQYRQNLDSWALNAAYTELPTSFTWTTEWKVKGPPDSKRLPRQFLLPVTTPGAQVEAECNVTMKKGAQTWIARHGAGVVASGTCQLTLSDVTQTDEAGNVIHYKIKGSIGAMLEAVPGTGAMETVNVTMDLCQGDSTLCVAPTMM